MRLRKPVFVPLCAVIVLAALTGLSGPCRALTRTVTASIRFVDSGVVNKTSDITFPPLPESHGAATLFMDSYGMTWAQQGDILQGRQGQAGVITIDDSGGQLVNFLTSNMDLNPGIEPLKVFCSMHADEGGSCKRLMMPDTGKKKKTIYIAMNVLIDALNKAAGTRPGKAPSSFDIAVVYQ